MVTYEEGYYEQSAYNEEANLGTTGLYRFGYSVDDKPMIDIGNNETVVTRDVYGQYYQSLEAGPQVADLISARFAPVNGRFLYQMLGNRTASTGTRTISNMDGTQRKPFLSTWKQTNNLKQHCYGTLWDSCTLSMAVGSHPIVSMVGKGLKIASDSYSPTITYEGSVDSRFDVLSGMTWDGDALTPYASTITLRQGTKPILGYDGRNQDINDQVPTFGTINFICSASEGESIYVDFEASSAKTFTFTLDKSVNAHQIVGTFANARVIQSQITEKLGMLPIYNVIAAIETSSFGVTDGL